MSGGAFVAKGHPVAPMGIADRKPQEAREWILSNSLPYLVDGVEQRDDSAYFVGDEANFEKQGLMNANPASLAERYDETSEGAAAINP